MLLPFRVTFFASLLASIGLFVIALLWNDPRFFLVAVAHLGLSLLLLVPVFSRNRIELFEPFTLLTAYVVIGTIGNAYVLAFTQSRRQEALSNGEPLEVFIQGAVWLAVGLFLIGLGYGMCRRRLRVERVLPNEAKMRVSGLHLAALFGLMAALLATAIYIQQTGGIGGLANLSRKRALEVVTGGEVVYASGGYLRLVAAVPMLVLYVLLAFYLQRGRRLAAWQVLFLGALLVGGAVLPFLSSSRSGVAFSLLGVLFVLAVHGRLNRKAVLVSTVVVMTLFSVMTGLRLYANLSRGAESQAQLDIPNPIVALAESGNGMSLSGTALIFDGVPERMDYKYGTTFFSWIVAPIPRSMWPGKPQISLGKEIKTDILQKPAIKSGRPAGIIQEGYINFGAPGFFLLAISFGYMLRLAENSFRPILTSNAFASSLYFAVFLNLPALANASLSQGMVRFLSDIIPIYLIFVAAVALSWRPAAPRYRTGSQPVAAE